MPKRNKNSKPPDETDETTKPKKRERIVAPYDLVVDDYTEEESAILQELREIKARLDVDSARFDELKLLLGPEMMIRGHDGLVYDGLIVENTAPGVSRTLDKKALLLAGVTEAQIKQATIEKPKAGSVKVSWAKGFGPKAQ